MGGSNQTTKITRREFFKPSLTGAKAWAADLFAAVEEKEAGPKWAMAIDLKKCIGCDTCTVSCKAENRTPPGVTYNVVMKEEVGTFPNVTKVNTPRPCMQCDQPACGQVCPVKATYKMKNGIVAVDYKRCIGCRYCMVACPYGARYFDFGESYEQEMIGFNQTQTNEYGVKKDERRNNKAPIGVVRKCHFCFHRLNRGEEPACVETCLGDARYFGDLNDPTSVISKLINSSRADRLKEYMATEPRVYYLK
jgi:molybdopterin-containing oxidoreductase family iron-sulfur binding subunit